MRLESGGSSGTVYEEVILNCRILFDSKEEGKDCCVTEVGRGEVEFATHVSDRLGVGPGSKIGEVGPGGRWEDWVSFV